MRVDPSYFRAVSDALLRSSHHDADKAQAAVNELFLSIAIRFSRSTLRGNVTSGPGADDDFELHPDLAAAREVRSLQTFFTHRSVSTFDRVSFQLTDELVLYGTTLTERLRLDVARGEGPGGGGGG
jgi:hypothetical protein